VEKENLLFAKTAGYPEKKTAQESHERAIVSKLRIFIDGVALAYFLLFC
jgi:hypothetical protein